MRIDAHQHFWTLARGDYDWLTPDLAPLYGDFEPDDLYPLLEEHGVTGTIAVQAAETDAETLHLLDLASRHDWILGVVGWCDLGAPDAAGRIASLAADPHLVGLRPMLQDMDDDDWILRPGQARGLAAMAREGLVFDALIRPRHIPRIAELADRHPTLSIMIDHAAKPPIGETGGFPAWRDAMQEIARRPNVACKLSGLVTEATAKPQTSLFRATADLLLEAFGADRLVWGSDWPVLRLRADYADWVALSSQLLGACTGLEREAIMGGNACRIYRPVNPGGLVQQ
jgi:L-fuconolactonase